MKKTAKIVAFFISASLVFNSPAVFTASAQEKEKTVTLGGQPFGVKFYNDGVMVIELEEFVSGNKYVCPAKDGGLQVGDIIKKINDTPVKTNEDVQSATFGCDGKRIKFTIIRDGKELVKTVVPRKNTVGIYLLGAWVRDSCAGIGTVTYYDRNDDYFAALGHGICDSDTLELMPLGSAEVVNANINSITKSVEGKAGSLNGYFTENTIGTLTKNTDCGIFGTADDTAFGNGVELEVAENGEIKLGKAEIYTTVDGNEAECFEAEITDIRSFDSSCNENFVIKITDERLIERCGGIVQGMSGSPIVQNGKLAGAVTHVFLNDPDEGYGVTAQNMVSNYKS